MRRKIIGMALVVMLGAALVGCQTTSGYYDPTMSAGAGLLGGGAGGAVLGAIIGAATGNPGAGAAIGAASGAVVGGLGGALYANNQNRGQAAQGPPPPGYGYPQSYSYQKGYSNPQGYDDSEGYWKTPGYGPSSYNQSAGEAVAIDQAYVNPVSAQPGSQIMLTMNYRVASPQDQPVSVKLVREISRDGWLVDQPYAEPRQVQNGPHDARVAYEIPPDAVPGNYVATFKVVSDQGTSERKVNFTVQ